MSHDGEAWNRFVDVYGPLVYYWIGRYRLADQDTADLFQEVFLAVVIAIRRFDQDRSNSTMRGWLWTITRNKILDLYRRQKSATAAIGGSAAHLQFSQVPAAPPDDDDATQMSLTTSIVHRGLDDVKSEFEERTWQAFWRVTVEGHETAEVAAEMGITSGAVRQAKSRVLRRLREELDGLLD
jgi:RNA polymerase sigma-70 factor (ECF subfamily)